MNDRWGQSGHGEWEDDRSRIERQRYGRNEESERDMRDDESANAGRSRNYVRSRSGGEWYGGDRSAGSVYGDDWRGADRGSRDDWRGSYAQGARSADPGRSRYGSGEAGRFRGDRSRRGGWPSRYGGEADDRYGGDWDRKRGRAYLDAESETSGYSSEFARQASGDWGSSYGEGTGDYRDQNRDRSYWGGAGEEYVTHRDYGRDRHEGRPRYRGERDWWERTKDEVRSWMGDEDANRRREMDEMRNRRNRGPRGYTRSDERIKEDVSDRLSEGWLDASDIEVQVSSAEVTLNGHVDSRSAKRRAEDLADSVSGVRHVQNNLRVRDPYETAGSGTTVAGTGTGTSSPTSTGSGASTGVGTGSATGSTSTATTTPTGGTTRPRH